MKWPLSIQLSMVTGTSPQSHNGPKFTPTPRFTSHWGFTISLRNFVFPYRPQSSLKQTLIKLSIKLSLDWTKLLLALVKLRALPQKPLQFSLLEVMFGRTSAILGLEISPPPLPPTCPLPSFQVPDHLYGNILTRPHRLCYSDHTYLTCSKISYKTTSKLPLETKLRP